MLAGAVCVIISYFVGYLRVVTRDGCFLAWLLLPLVSGTTAAHPSYSMFHFHLLPSLSMSISDSDSDPDFHHTSVPASESELLQSAPADEAYQPEEKQIHHTRRRIGVPLEELSSVPDPAAAMVPAAADASHPASRAVPMPLWLELPPDARLITHFIRYDAGPDFEPNRRITIRLVEVQAASRPEMSLFLANSGDLLSLFVSRSNVSKKTADLGLQSPLHKIETYCLGDRSDQQRVGQKQVMLTPLGLATALAHPSMRRDRDPQRAQRKQAHCRWIEEVILPILMGDLRLAQLQEELLIDITSLEHTLELANRRHNRT